MNDIPGTLRSLALASVLALGLPGAVAAELPSADEIVARHVAAIGGAEAVAAHAGHTIRGTLSMPAAGVAGSFEMRAAPPDRFLLKVEIPGIGAIRQGFDGEVAWSIDPLSGPMVLEGRARLQIADQAAWDAELFPAASYEVRETVGEVPFGDGRAFKVRMVSKDGLEAFEMFDVESGLHVGTEADVETPLGAIRVVSTQSAYREFGGVRMATRYEQDFGPQGTQIMTVEDVGVGEVEPGSFALPVEIRTLLTPEAPAPSPAAGG